MFVDESGNAGPPNVSAPGSRYMALVGAAIPQDHRYANFEAAVAELKTRHLPASSSRPVILHREEIVRRVQDGFHVPK